MRHQKTRHKLCRDSPASQGAAAEPLQGGHRARADPDDRGQGQGRQARGREADHAGQARRPARPPPGAVGAGSGQVHRVQAVRGCRSPLRRPPRRLHRILKLGRAGRTRPRWSSWSWSERARPPPSRRRRGAMVTKLTLEYDGAEFAGWARQPGRRTVQGELERALARSSAQTTRRRALRLTVAGRTDRGVHAWGQVAAMRTRPSTRRLNALLRRTSPRSPPSRPPGFDARRDARSRTYCYRILARRTRSASSAGARCGGLARRPRGLDACARRCRAARLHRLHADRDRARAFRAAPCSRAEWRGTADPGVLDRGRRVHAPYEPGAGRARCSRWAGGRPELAEARSAAAGRPRDAAPRRPRSGLGRASVAYSYPEEAAAL